MADAVVDAQTTCDHCSRNLCGRGRLVWLLLNYLQPLLEKPLWPRAFGVAAVKLGDDDLCPRVSGRTSPRPARSMRTVALGSGMRRSRPRPRRRSPAVSSPGTPAVVTTGPTSSSSGVSRRWRLLSRCPRSTKSCSLPPVVLPFLQRCRGCHWGGARLLGDAVAGDHPQLQPAAEAVLVEMDLDHHANGVDGNVVVIGLGGTNPPPRRCSGPADH